MRAFILETLAVTVIAVMLVCAALGMLPSEVAPTWAGRTEALLRTAATLDFSRAHWADPTAFAFISARAWTSIKVIAATTGLLVAVGVPLGVASVTRSRSAVVRGLRQMVNGLSSLPVLVLGTFIYVVMAREFRVTPREDVSATAAFGAAIVAVTLGDRVLADIVQRVELATRAVLAQPYMRAVRAADLGFRRHLFQSMLPAVAEALSSRAMFLISGAIVAEFIFFVHGLGLTVLQALKNNDDPRVILASSMALIVIGLAFRVAHRGALVAADARRRA